MTPHWVGTSADTRQLLWFAGSLAGQRSHTKSTPMFELSRSASALGLTTWAYAACCIPFPCPRAEAV